MQDTRAVMHALRLSAREQSWGRMLLENHVGQMLSVVRNRTCADAIATVLRTLSVVVDEGRHPDTWALRMVEASGKAPQGLLTGNPSMLGDYDECLGTRGPTFEGQYCLVRACHSPHQQPCASLFFAEAAARAQKSFGKERLELSSMSEALEGLPLRVGLCVPSVCSAADISAVAERALAPLSVAAVRVDLDPIACRVAGQDLFGAAEYCALALILIVVLWSTVASIYDYATRGRRRNEWVVAFSALANAAAILHVGGGADEGGGSGGGGGGKGRDSLPPLHALRVISFLIVVVGHSLVTFMDFPSANLEVAIELSREPDAVFVAISPLAVDVFLLLGGLLVAYIFFNHMAQGGEFHLFPFYLYRYIRLTPALGIVLFLQSTVLLKLNDGPLWRLQHAQQCPKTWWYIMLHICNYFRPQTVTCLGHLWYLSLDWHMYILSPLALLALRRRPSRALMFMGALCTFSMVARFLQAYSLRLRAPWTPYGVQEGLRRLYFPTHARFEPYVVGIVLGYALHRLKGLKTPLVLTQTQVRVMWSSVVIGLTVTFYVMWKVGDPDLPYHQLLESIFISVVHFEVSVLLALLVFLTMAGYGGFVGRLMCHRWWRPLSRLTFCMYLVHYSILHSLMWSLRKPAEFSKWNVIELSFTVWLLSLPFSFLLAVLFECPAVQLARVAFDWHMKKMKKLKTGKRQKNGELTLIGPNDAKEEQFLNEVKIFRK